MTTLEKKEKEIEPDGFPKENDIKVDTPSDLGYCCDCCHKKLQFSKGFRVDAIGSNEQGTYFHYYSFCDKDCADLFAQKYGLVMEKTTDKEKEEGVETSYTFKLADPVAAAVKTILPEDVTPETKPEKECSEEAPTELNEVEMFTEEKPTCYEKKATECWKHVVKTAQEISQAASKIVVLQDQLKEAKKEYDALVSRQNSYILTNGDSIQTTFADMDSVPEPTITEDAAAEEQPAVDPDEWKLKSVRVLPGFTEKQMDKIEANFSTLGAVQEWSCKDFREKMPGIGQALQDKLIDAMSDYAVAWQQKANDVNEVTQKLEESDNV